MCVCEREKNMENPYLYNLNWRLGNISKPNISPMPKYSPSECLLFFLFFGCTGSSLPCTGFLQLWRAGATLHCGVQASHYGGFSYCGAWAIGARASVVVVCGLSSCGGRAYNK